LLAIAVGQAVVSWQKDSYGELRSFHSKGLPLPAFAIAG
jgi:hypothetical protein